jgi:hypothetical protein
MIGARITPMIEPGEVKHAMDDEVRGVVKRGLVLLYRLFHHCFIGERHVPKKDLFRSASRRRSGGE